MAATPLALDVCVLPAAARRLGHAPTAALAPDGTALAYLCGPGDDDEGALAVVAVDERSPRVLLPAPRGGSGGDRSKSTAKESDAWVAYAWLVHEDRRTGAHSALAAVSRDGQLALAFFDAPVSLCLATFAGFHPLVVTVGRQGRAVATAPAPTNAGDYWLLDVATHLPALLGTPAPADARVRLLGTGTGGVVLGVHGIAPSQQHALALAWAEGTPMRLHATAVSVHAAVVRARGSDSVTVTALAYSTGLLFAATSDSHLGMFIHTQGTHRQRERERERDDDGGGEVVWRPRHTRTCRANRWML
jgi:hypothetical protein